MENNYNVVFLFLLGGLAMGLVGMGLATIIRPHRPNPLKQDIYECGPETIGTSWIKYNFRFYTYVLVFLLFDIEAVYLIPWAQCLRHISKEGLDNFIGMPFAAGVFVLMEMLIFLIILIVGLIYAYCKGALDWNRDCEEIRVVAGR